MKIECFYKNSRFQSNELHNRIADLVENETFRQELQTKETKPAAPHELMSVIIGIKNYGTLIGNSEEKEFFARCITGYTYENDENNPVVLYEAYIIKHIIMHLNEKLIVKEDDKEITKLFSEDALSREGIILNNNVKVSLLCDDDIIYLYKNLFPDDLSNEFFHRNKRRHPLWKSEREDLLSALS